MNNRPYGIVYRDRNKGPAWGFIFIVALIALFLPYFTLFTYTSKLPESIRIVVEPLSLLVLWPGFLCWLYSRKVFASGKASRIFWVYTVFYALMGIVTFFTAPAGEDGSNIEIKIMGVLLFLVGTSMYIWSRRTREKYTDALIYMQELEREDQINIHTEAILRAEEIKKARAADPDITET